MDKLALAYHFAATKHINQRRKNTIETPYINHPIEVAFVLTCVGIIDPDVLCAAVLHDTVEDTETKMNELTKLFGDNVSSIVAECSDDKSLDKISRKRLQIERALYASNQAKLVKLADKYSNLSGLFNDPPKTWKKETIDGYVKWCFVVCQHLYGVNENLDKMLKDLFIKFGVTNVSNEDLDAYYEVIDETE